MNVLAHEALSQYADRDTPLSTHPDSAFWRKAPSLILETDTYGKQIPGHRTELRSRWTKRSLYFLFLCPYRELHLKPEPQTIAKTDGLWNWDVAETFIGSVKDPLHRYREFELSPQGEWLDLDINLEKPDKVNDPAWSSGFEVSARIEPEEKIWYGTMRIPYAAIEDREAAVGNTLRINFFRSQGPNHIELAWQPSFADTFHVPEQFGLFRLVL